MNANPSPLVGGRTDDLDVGMTPMIDIVFQLLVFFLLVLRFKSVEHRIESRLPEPGRVACPRPLEDRPSIRATLHRVDAEDAARAFTRVRLGTRATVDLPAGPWTGESARDAARLDAYARAGEALSQAIAGLRADQGFPADLRGILATPPRHVGAGSAVPHGDVVRVLDAFLAAGVTDVAFEGTALPLPRR
jgi:biopolymer transport protein ExbD